MKQFFSDFKRMTNMFIFIEILVVLILMYPFNTWLQFFVLFLGLIFSIWYSYIGIQFYLKNKQKNSK